jgi:hypothetical protein
MDATSSPSARHSRWGTVAIVLLCLLAVGRSWWGTRLDGFTVDEPWHAVAGTVYLRDNDFSLNPEHPPLVKLVAGTALHGHLKLPTTIAPTEKAQERNLVERTVYLDNDPDAVQHRTRIALWTFSALLLLILGLLLRRAFGLPWALGSLAFLAIEPSVAAHLPVVMTDLPVALTLGLATLCCGLLAATWQWRWAMAAGLSVGLALGSKHSAVAGLAGLAVALLVAAALAWRSRQPGQARRALLQTLAVAALGLGSLWSMYGGHFHADADGGDHFNRSMQDKVADLQIPAWRTLIGTADRLHVAPRSYLWGLADTVRAGVEGRGPPETRLWGTNYHGPPPWFTWPSIIAGKLPLALLAMSLLGLLALPWLRLPATARCSLAMLAAMAIAHLLALAQSQGTYGGIRHALPLVIALAVVAGAGVALAWQTRNRWLQLASTGLLALALLTTIGEPRAWEFQNLLAGGTRDGWRQFANEGMHLGQRSIELRDFYRRVIKPSGEALYIDTWTPESQLRSYGMPKGNYVEDLNDTNISGDYAGWFVYETWAHLPEPQRQWNPDEVFRHLRLAKRIGNVEIWHGTQHFPDARARSVYNRVIEFIYRDGKQDWPLVAAKLAEVNARLPYHVGAGVELGNALLRMGKRDAALQTYQRLLVAADSQLDPLTRATLQRQIAALAASPQETVAPLRNPWLE